MLEEKEKTVNKNILMYQNKYYSKKKQSDERRKKIRGVVYRLGGWKRLF